MSDDPANVLYISYDGMTDPLGQSQVLPYLQGLSALGHQITIISCEKDERWTVGAAKIKAICRDAGITWRPVTYRKRPPIISPLDNLMRLKRLAVREHRRNPFHIIHCRSYIPGVVGAHLKGRYGTRFLFDMRGFWPDERVDGRLWPQNKALYRQIYRYVKKLETKLLRTADHIISLTEAGKRELLSWPAMERRAVPVTVIPCCTDFDAFKIPTTPERLRARAELGIQQTTKIVSYLGSVGTWYMLDEMLDFFAEFSKRESDSKFLFITQDSPQTIEAAAQARRIPAGNILVRAATRDQVPQLMAAADIGLFFIKPAYSKLASSPTKLGEMLAMGLPVVTNGGVGDVEAVLSAMECGVVVETFSADSYVAAAKKLQVLTLDPEEVRRRALPWFDVRSGVDRYNSIYGRLTRRQAIRPTRLS